MAKTHLSLSHEADKKGVPAKKGNEVCLNHLFTHANFGTINGLAEVGTNCARSFSNVAFTSTSAGGSRMSLAARQIVTARQIGHNFGAELDCYGDTCKDYLLLPDTPDISDDELAEW